MKSLLLMMVMVSAVSVSQAYLIQEKNLNIEYWAGTGANECVVAIDWNATNGPYASAFHIFGYRWDGDKTVADVLAAIDAAGAVDIVYGYGGGFISHIYFDQTLVDGDNHTSANYAGWWWLGDTQDGGQTWDVNNGGTADEYLWNGGIEGINIDGRNWSSDNMTIPEPATFILLAFGVGMFTRKKA
jgi:hypothetical protein